MPLDRHMQPKTVAISHFYINLDRSPARRAHMETLFGDIGITAHRIQAVDGTQLTDAACRLINPPRPGFRALSKPEIGCFQSHRKAWQHIVDGPHEWGCICEDDLTFSADIRHYLTDAAWIPAGIALVKLESIPQQPVLLSKRRIPLDGGRGLARLGSVSFGTGCYLLTQSTAAGLLAATEQYDMPVDHVVFDPSHAALPGLAAFQVVPSVGIQQVVLDGPAFLPAGAEVSGLETERARLANTGKKLRGVAKLKREVLRPFRQFTALTDPVWRPLLSRYQWQNIPFRR